MRRITKGTYIVAVVANCIARILLLILILSAINTLRISTRLKENNELILNTISGDLKAYIVLLIILIVINIVLKFEKDSIKKWLERDKKEKKSGVTSKTGFNNFRDNSDTIFPYQDDDNNNPIR